MIRAATRIVTFSVELLISVTGILVVPGVNAQTLSRQLRSPAQLSAIVHSTAVFIENHGQFDPRVKFQAKVGGQTAWLTAEGIVFDVTRRAADEPSKDNVPDIPVPDRSFRPRETRLPLVPRDAASVPHTLDRLVFSEGLVQAGCCSKVEGREPQPGIYNYFQGRDPSQWHTKVRGFAEVVYHNVWPGIDLRVYGNGPNLEQEFVVRPGSDLSLVQVTYRGVDNLRIALDGSLEVATAFGTLRETKPQIFQQAGGKREAVDGKYLLTSSTSYSFDVKSRDLSAELVIDPTLLYSTFLGGSAGYNGAPGDSPLGIAVDASGNAYVGGNTASSDFPTTVGVYSTAFVPNAVGFVTKLNATGSELIYSTFFDTGIAAFAADSSGRAFVAGFTGNAFYGSFPTTPNAYWPTNPSQSCTPSADIFLTELSTGGSSLLYSTCFNATVNGGETISGIATDGNGKVYIAGNASGPVPTTSGAYQPSLPPRGGGPFISVVDTTASGAASLVYSTYLGNTFSEITVVSAIAVDSFGKFYVTGSTQIGFPTTAASYQPAHAPCTVLFGAQYGNCYDAFIAKLDPSSSGSQSLIYSTYLGGHGDEYPNAIAVDSSGNIYVTGRVQNYTSADFPITPGAFETSGNIWVSKLNAGGSQLLYSTYFNGSANAAVSGIAVDSSGDAFLVGYAAFLGPPGFPVTANAFQPTYGGADEDGYLTELNPTGSGLIYSTYLGGADDDAAIAVALDQVGDAYVTGWTGSANFPVTPTASQPALNPGSTFCDGCFPEDAFIVKFPLGVTQTLSISSISPTSGGNAGTVTASIVGGGFHSGAVVSLVGGTTIIGSAASVSTEGRTIGVTFNIAGASVGSYSLTVANPDGTTVTLPNAFTVQQGGAPNIQMSITGLAVQEGDGGTSTNSVVNVIVSNRGSVDSTGTLVLEPVTAPFALTSVSPNGVAGLTSLTAGSEAVWSTPPLAVGSSQIFTLTATAASSPSTSSLAASACVMQDFQKQAYAFCLATDACELCALTPCSPGDIQKERKACSDCVMAGANCSDGTSSCPADIQTCLADLSSFSSLVKRGINNACIDGVCGSGQVPFVFAVDPNSIVGPSGVGGQGWASGAQSLAYGISFSNEPTAPVPAQQVVVTQPLGANVNLNTLTLLGINIPNGTSSVQVSVPPGSFNPGAGLNDFTTIADLRPAQSLLVNVDAALNTATRTLTWTLGSIDPATGLPPVNPLVGLLQPSFGGSVAFTVLPTTGLATGTVISDQAAVVFNANAPLSTTTWTNTIDNTAPVSKLSALAATQTTSCFRPQWTATDVGSGVQGTTIFVSDTGGAYTPWLTNTTSASAIYNGAAGHTYAFYSQATDLVGNVEAPHTGPDASTIVPAGASCNGRPTIAGSVASNALSGTTETLTVQLTNNGVGNAQNINITSISLRTLVGSGAVTLSSPATPISVGSLAAGASVTETFTLNAPATVKEYSITEAGTVQDVAGNTYSFSIAEAVIP